MADKSYHELTDEERKILERKLPAAKSKGRPQIENRADIKKRSSVEILAFQIRQMEQRLQEISTMGKCGYF